MSEKKEKRKSQYFDLTLLFMVLFIVAFGLVMVYSTSSYSASLQFEGNSLYFLRKQIISVVVGLFAMVVMTFFPLKLLQKLYGAAYLFSAATVLLILTKLGYTANGATRWLRIFGFSIQVAEICKFCGIIFVAALLAKMGPNTRKGWKGFFFPMIPIWFVCLLLYGITDNLSSAIIVCLIGVFMILVSEKKNIWPIIFLSLVGVVCVFTVLLVVKGWLPASASFRLERVLAWLDPEAYADGKGMQILQSLYGIGSGGIWGKGLGKSMQKLGFLPEAQNDMIFSIICEELGLVGGLSVIVMFTVLLWRIRDIAVHSRNYFGNLLVTGVFCHIAIQVILNIAVVTNTIPNTGISLPFISYGGCSVIFLLAEIGLVMNVGRSAQFTSEETNEA